MSHRDEPKDEPYDENNYRPIRILSNLSKICERYMHDEINAYFDDALSEFQCGSSKYYSTQHYLLFPIEKIRKMRGSNGVFAAALTDLSKAFDLISHELLLIKLRLYGFDKIALTFRYAYLCQRRKKLK